MTDAISQMPSQPNLALTPLIRAGAVSLIALIGGLGGASALIPIDGAVVAQGQVLVQGKAHPVQSLDAGRVAAVKVENGQHVVAGDVLLSLDPTVAQAQLNIAMEQLASALAEQSRLTSEVTGQGTITFVLPELPFPAPDTRDAAKRQEALFTARQNSRTEAQNQLADTLAQLSAQIDGVLAQLAAADDEHRLLLSDLERQQGLVEKGLARQGPLNDLQRQEAALTGRVASLSAERLRLISAQDEARSRLAQDNSRRAEEIAQGLRDTSAKIQELTSQIVALRDALSRTDLRAPVAGIVHELSVTGPGAVISAGTTLVQIVPTDRGMEIEVAVDPRNIDSIHSGQSAQIMVSAFDPRNVPKLPAHVTNIPPGAMTDPNSGRSYYRVTLALDQNDLPENVTLLPGMPVEAFLSTGERPLLSWLLAPLVEPMARALRED